MNEIPHELIINQTGFHYVPVGSWTMDKEGAKRVEIAGVDDKRQITAVLAGSLSGDYTSLLSLYYSAMSTNCAIPP